MADLESGSAFLKLPVEIRLKIYEHVFEDNLIVIIGGFDTQASKHSGAHCICTQGLWTTEHGLLLVCKQLREEARKVYSLTLELQKFTNRHHYASLDSHLSESQKLAIWDIIVSDSGGCFDDRMMDWELFPNRRLLTLADLTSESPQPGLLEFTRLKK